MQACWYARLKVSCQLLRARSSMSTHSKLRELGSAVDRSPSFLVAGWGIVSGRGSSGDHASDTETLRTLVEVPRYSLKISEELYIAQLQRLREKLMLRLAGFGGLGLRRVRGGAIMTTSMVVVARKGGVARLLLSALRANGLGSKADSVMPGTVRVARNAAPPLAHWSIPHWPCCPSSRRAKRWL